MNNSTLTERQKNMIRSLKEGLETRTIKTEWGIIPGDDGIIMISGLDDEAKLWREVWHSITGSDFAQFVQCGLMSIAEYDGFGRPSKFHLNEGAIIQAINHDFR